MADSIIGLLCTAVVETIRESPEPVPESLIFLGLESRGVPHHIVKLILDTLVAAGRLNRSNHLLTVA
jgi:hypothetical protein